MFTLGIPELRQKIAEYHSANPDNVVVTTGSSGAFVALFLAVLDPGDSIVMTQPGPVCGAEKVKFKRRAVNY